MPERQLSNTSLWSESVVLDQEWPEDLEHDESREWRDLTRNIQTTHKQQLRDWLQHRILEASRSLENNVEIDPSKYSGTPVVRGTRFKIAQLLATLAEGEDISDLADDMDLDEHRLRDIIRSLSTFFDRPVKK